MARGFPKVVLFYSRGSKTLWLIHFYSILLLGYLVYLPPPPPPPASALLALKRAMNSSTSSLVTTPILPSPCRCTSHALKAEVRSLSPTAMRLCWRAGRVGKASKQRS